MFCQKTFVKLLIYRRSAYHDLLRHCSGGQQSANAMPENNASETKTPNQKLSYRPQVKVTLDPELHQKLSEKETIPRKHPGLNKLKVVSLPDKILDTFQKVIGDHPVKKLMKDAVFLDNYLKARHVPAEQYELRTRMKDIQLEIESKFNVDPLEFNDDQLLKYRKAVNKQTQKLLKSRVFAWKALDFDEYRSRMYLFARSVQDYATIQAVLKEIVRRDPEFKPRSFLDFGSGVGTGSWAVSSLWKDSIFEYFNVDSSSHMNDLAELILKGGEENKQISLNNVYYRQFLGAPSTSYDIVLSAYSLIELPNRKARLETLANLWARCTGYLILIELGTNTGFKLIHEARKFFTNLKEEERTEGYIFAPCPHELTCPRYSTEDNSKPCNFGVRYFALPFFNIPEPKLERFSYIVLKKNGKREEDPAAQWPRLVRETLVKTRHTFCRLCTKEGKLQEMILTPGKHGKQAYQCAKHSRWGDQLPMEINIKINNRNEEEE